MHMHASQGFWAQLGTFFCGVILALSAGSCDPASEPELEGGCSACSLTDENNLRLDVSLETDDVLLLQQQDHLLGWSGLTEDLLTRPLYSCEEIEDVTLYQFPSMDQASILEGLAHGDLDQAAICALWRCEPRDCGCALSEFSYVGHPLVPETDFLAQTGERLLTLGGGSTVGIRAMVFLSPTDSPGPVRSPSWTLRRRRR